VSNPVRRLLELFDSLPEPDKRSAVVEILRRNPPGDGDLHAAQLDGLADELFSALDAAEAARARLTSEELVASRKERRGG